MRDMKTSKYGICILIVLCIALSSIVGCTGVNSLTEFTFSAKVNSALSDIACDNKGNIILADKDILHIMAGDGSNVREVDLKGYFITNICADGDFIYAVDPFNGALLIVKTENGDFEKKTFKSESTDIKKITKIGGLIYFLGAVDNEPQLCAYDLENEQLEILPVENVYNFTAYKDNLILEIGKSNSSFVIYDPLQNTKIDELMLSDKIKQTAVLDMVWDDRESKLYYASMNGIYAFDFANPEEDVLLLPNSESETQFSLGYSESGLYVLQKTQQNVSFSNKNEFVFNSENGLQVRISNAGIVNDFKAEKNAAVMELNPLGYGDNERFAVQMMSGDESTDIFEINSSYSSSYNFIRNKVYLPLDKSSKITDYMKKLPQKLYEYSSHEGELFGVPVSLSFSATVYDELLLKETGFGIENLTTWDKLMARGDELFNRYPHMIPVSNRLQVTQIMLNQYFANYCNLENKEISYDTKAFREVLKEIKKANSYIGFQYEGMLSDDTAPVTVQSVSPENIDRKPSLHEPPSINEEKNKVPLSMTWRVINPNSKNIELAMSFLEFGLENTQRVDGSYIPAKEGSDDMQLPVGWHEKYLQIVENSSLNFELDIYNSIIPILNEYYKEVIDEDTAAKQIDEKVNMIINE